MEILEFSWLPALAGGIMIGTASALLMAFNGRVAGISGILGGLLSRSVSYTHLTLPTTYSV